MTELEATRRHCWCGSRLSFVFFCFVFLFLFCEFIHFGWGLILEDLWFREKKVGDFDVTWGQRGAIVDVNRDSLLFFCFAFFFSFLRMYIISLGIDLGDL